MKECGYLQKYITSIKIDQDNKTNTKTLEPAMIIPETGSTELTNTTVETNTTAIPDNTTQDHGDAFTQKTSVADTHIERSNQHTPSPVFNMNDLSSNTQKYDTRKELNSIPRNILPDKVHADKATRINNTVTPHKKDKTFAADTKDVISKDNSAKSKAQIPGKTGVHSGLNKVSTKNQNISINKSIEDSAYSKDSNLISGLVLITVISIITLLLFLAYDMSMPEKISISDSESPNMRDESRIKSDHLLKRSTVTTRNKIKEPIALQIQTTNDAADSDLVNIEHQQLQNDIVSTTKQHAIIQEDRDGIIIELDPPVSLEKNIVHAGESAFPRKYNQSLTIISSDETILNPKSIENIEFIEHIIVKGDTLWSIAKHYIHNPFRYPELARLSNINNPDLIYPGNKVLIIKHPRKDKTEN